MKVIDETEQDFRTMIDKDFGLDDGKFDFELRLLDWIHYQARRIPIRPRTVGTSEQIEAARAAYPAIDLIERDLKAGADMAPWLSDRIRRQKKWHKADLMFNDWQIVHFHTNPIFLSNARTKRSGPLLFARVEANTATLLDIQPHGAWTAQSLLEILVETCPQMMAKRELKGVLALSKTYTEEEHMALRQAGITVPVLVKGRLYTAPGLGLSTSGHATRLVVRLNQLKRTIREVRDQIEQNTMSGNLRMVITQNLSLPVRLGISLLAGELRLIDKNRGALICEFPCFE